MRTKASHKTHLWVLLLQFSFLGISVAQIQYPIIAHSHNDYEQGKPILKALEYGFNSLEVDIVLHKNELLISHDIDDCENKPFFEENYLVPLIEYSNQTRSPEILLIDIKNYSLTLIDRLDSIVKKYEHYFLNRTDLTNSDLKIQIILSGEIPREFLIGNEKYKFFFIDGRIEEINQEYYQLYTPWISIDYKDITTWKGIKRPDRWTLKNLVSTIEKVHSKNMKIRFWNTNETILLWSTLLALKVDIIGVDHIEGFYSQMKRINMTKEADHNSH